MTKSKSVPFSQYIEKMFKDPAFKAQMDQLKEFKKAKPAEFDRKYNKKLMDLCMEINGRHSIIAWCTENIQHSDQDMSKDELDTIWDRRKNETYAVARLYAQYDQLVAELDLAVHNERAKQVL